MAIRSIIRSLFGNHRFYPAHIALITSPNPLLFQGWVLECCFARQKPYHLHFMAFFNGPPQQEITRNDQQAYERICKQYKSASLKFCVSLIKDKSEATHLVNHVFEHIRDHGLIINEDHDFKTYLFVHLRDTVIDYLKNAGSVT